MALARRIARPALALLVIAHGWAHAVLPLRGFITPDTLGQDAMPMILYGVAMLGFTAGGLGILGLWPFVAATRPLLVVASGYSLVALWILGHHDLWPAAVLDVALLLGGATGAVVRPRVAAAGRLRRGVAGAVGILVFGYTTVAVLWPIHRAWGSRPHEFRLTLPGDGPDRHASLEIQHAVTIQAPPAAVWPWLLQLGQDRAGFYSYDWLERAFGVDIRNVGTIRPEWQQRAVGDLVRATQEGYLGGVFGPDLGWHVRDIHTERALVLEYWGTFALVPAESGTTRFIIRTPVGDERLPAWAAAADMMMFQLPHFIMERRMMLQIKALAESATLRARA